VFEGIVTMYSAKSIGKQVIEYINTIILNLLNADFSATTTGF